jgi:flagellar capping protein FliD
LFDVDPDVVLNDTAGFSTLSLVGINTTNDGKLEIDDAVLEAKMSEDLEAFADLFVDYDGFDNGGAPPNTPGFYEDQTADAGLAALLVREIDRMFGSYEGPVDPLTGENIQLDALFDLKEDTLHADIDGFNDQIESMERRLDAFERNLVLRFARLEELMGSLNAQGSARGFALQNLS